LLLGKAVNMHAVHQSNLVLLPQLSLRLKDKQAVCNQPLCIKSEIK
jgi:hypothetical protein